MSFKRAIPDYINTSAIHPTLKSCLTTDLIGCELAEYIQDELNKQGVVLSKEDINKDTIHILWRVRLLSDRELSEIFNVSKYYIGKYRKDNNITTKFFMHENFKISYDFFNSLPEDVRNSGEAEKLVIEYMEKKAI